MSWIYRESAGTSDEQNRRLPLFGVLKVCVASFHLPLQFLNVGTSVGNYLSLLTFYSSYPVWCLPCSLHKQYHSGLCEWNRLSMFHTPKEHRLNRHLTYSAERHWEAAFVHASAIIILEPSLSALRSPSSLVVVKPASDGGLHATWLAPRTDLMQTLCADTPSSAEGLHACSFVSTQT